MKRSAALSLFLTAFFLLLHGCAGFDRLTTVDQRRGKAPASSDCAKCHIEQYREWHGSAHNMAYTDPFYRKATDNYDNTDCLTCHVPSSIRDRELQARSFARDEGISCIACHLQQGTMVGPHASSALFTPHPIRRDEGFYHSSKLCGICHQEVYAAWEKTAGQRQPAATVLQCRQCHMRALTRTSTKGTNFFSRFLVSFEEQHKVRSHRITLADMAPHGDVVRIKVKKVEHGQIAVNITNLLPHNLPGGEYTQSSLFLVITRTTTSAGGLPGVKIPVCDSDTPLAPGESKELAVKADRIGAHDQPTLLLILRRQGKNNDLQLAQTRFSSCPNGKITP